jgi:hypothetical protein
LFFCTGCSKTTRKPRPQYHPICPGSARCWLKHDVGLCFSSNIAGN